MDFDYSIHEHQHDPEKLSQKSHHAHDRKYMLKSPDVLPHPQIVATEATASSDVDLRRKSYIPPVLQQGNLGSCASCAMANNLYFVMGKEGIDAFHPSRLALYYNCRVNVEKYPADEDSGVTVSDMCTSVKQYHACPESDWPYEIAEFAKKPPAKATRDANLHKQFEFLPVQQTETSIKHCLSDGFPVILGIQIFSSFESVAVAETGIVPMPSPDEENLGGHCVTLYGYNDTKQAFLGMNSWGPWGLGGFFWIPYTYICDPNLCSDIWCVKFFK